ncbi:hypothetical protein J7E62_21395 [Variovorax paradoxus]|nr:hypothetical protein [Variovorax paradoxus]
MMLGSAWAYEAGRMTGGGAFFCPYLTLQRVTHEFELDCGTGSDFEGAAPAGPNKLEIGLSGGADFHLTRLKKGVCSTDKPDDQNRPAALRETFHGEGFGSFNGLGASITFAFTDAVEPGTEDTAEFEVKLASSGATVLECKSELPLILGNHRAYSPGNKPAALRSESTAVAEASAFPDRGELGGALYSPFAASKTESSSKASAPPQRDNKGSPRDAVVIVVGTVSSLAVAVGLGFLVLRFFRVS